MARRSAAEWTTRVLLAAAVAVVGFYSITFSLAQTLAKSNVELAHALAPYDGRITARIAASLAGPDATSADRQRADRLARQALKQDPSAVVAVSVLGLDTQLRGDTAGAQRLFAYSQKLSRRDLQTQLWAIEDAVGRGDVARALMHYDEALRTSPNASELLFPVLASAAADPAIRTALIRTLAGKPVWGESFIIFAAGNASDPRTTAALLLGLRRAGVAVPENASASAINALITSDLFEETWSYYASLRSGTNRRMSRDPRFIADFVTPSQLDWMPINNTGISTSIQRGDHGGIFDFAAVASTGGALLLQNQLLPPGDYRLEGHSIGIEQAENSRPYWALSCQDGRELGRVTMPNSSQAKGNFSGEFTVPAACAMQTLMLIARASDAVSGVSGQIDRVQLSPVR